MREAQLKSRIGKLSYYRVTEACISKVVTVDVSELI
jgi:hypothetical protein